MTSKLGSASYDPEYVFRSYNSNIPHLTNWIDELIGASESAYTPSTSYPSTENLVQSLKRYDTIFCELIKHNAIFSEQNTKLFAKTWKGVYSLVNFTIKNYHRYVKHTTYLQAQAQQLLNERLASMAANKVREEEFELERAALKARVRNLEAEIESLNSSNRSLDRENARARILIRTYIKNEDLNSKVWDLIEGLSEDLIDVSSSDDVPDFNTHNQSEPVHVGFKRKDTVDIGRQHHRMLTKIDVEMNAVLSSIEKEENRQVLLVNELVTLVSQHPNLFGPGKWENGKYKAGDTTLPDTTSIGIQVDSKDMHGIVEDLNENISPEDLAAEIAALPNPPKIPPNISATAIVTKIKGVEYPYQLRKLMKTFPRVLRIPPIIWTCETIMSIYGYMLMLDNKAANGINAAVNRRDIVTSSLSYATYRYFHDIFKVPSVADVHLAQFLRACEYHMTGAKRVALFASQLGMGAEKDKFIRLDSRDTRLIINIIEKCYNNDDTIATYQHLSNGPGSASLAASSTLSTNSDLLPPQPTIFTASISRGTNETPAQSRPTTNRSTAKGQRTILAPINHGSRPATTTSQLNEMSMVSNQETTNSANGSIANTPGNAHVRVLQTLHPDILRSVAVNAAQSIFAKLLANGGLDLMIRVNSLPATSNGLEYVYIDDIIEVLLEAWKPVRAHLEDHAKYLFHTYCGTYKVVSEVQFSSDVLSNGLVSSDRDAVVAQVPRSLTQDMTRRPLRIFQKIKNQDDGNDLGSTAMVNMFGKPNAKMVKDIRKKLIPVKRESVCELMPPNNFYDAIKAVIPSVTQDQANQYFEEGCDYGHYHVIKTLENIWVRLEDNVDTGTRRRQDVATAAANAAAAAYKRATMSDFFDQETADELNVGEDNVSDYDAALKLLSKRKQTSTETETDGPLRLATHREYYLNVETGQTQWVQPYRPRTFLCTELEIDAFVTMIIYNDFLLKCPLKKTILMSQPKDFWPNIENYYRQLDSISGGSGSLAFNEHDHPLSRSNSNRSFAGRRRRQSDASNRSHDEKDMMSEASSMSNSITVGSKNSNTEKALKPGKKKKIKAKKGTKAAETGS